jgi:hypothetical protein
MKYDLARAAIEARQCQDLLSQAQYHVARWVDRGLKRAGGVNSNDTQKTKPFSTFSRNMNPERWRI